jgi:hypothetical protein
MVTDGAQDVHCAGVKRARSCVGKTNCADDRANDDSRER